MNIVLRWCISAFFLCLMPAWRVSGQETETPAPSSIFPASVNSAAADTSASRNRSDTASVLALDSKTVTADRRDHLMETAQGFHEITAEQWRGTSKSIADVIAEQTGVQTRRYGGTGSFQTVSMRGVQGSEVLVLLDGIPLNSAMGGAVDLSIISPDRIGSIEIYKGVVPTRFSGNSIGGVINLRSASSRAGRETRLGASLGAYGYKTASAFAGNRVNKSLDITASLSLTHSDNDWPYLDRNNTPYNLEDDATRYLYNHGYDSWQVRVQPEIKIPGGRILNTAASFVSSTQALPADEGHINRTARYDRRMTDLTARLERDAAADNEAVTFIPEIGYMQVSEQDFWTSLDSGMAMSHGSFSTAPDSWGKTDYSQTIVHGALHAQIQPSDWSGADVSLFGRHSSADSRTRVIGFPFGDWPGERQEAGLSADMNAGLPAGLFRLGATCGGSLSGIRSATEGGRNEVFDKEAPKTDTVEFVWSAHGGINLHYLQTATLFFNAGRYSNLPGLREKYGTRGAVAPNPELTEETGVQLETGIRLRRSRLYGEAMVFRVVMENTILPLSDGTMTVPVNVGGSVVSGLEWTLSAEILKWLNTELRGTWQTTENRSRAYTWYGRELPNEPELSLLGKLIAGPFHGLTLHYWTDYKSPFYRDFANTRGQRVASLSDGIGNGLLFHNAMAEWKAFGHLECRLSLRNFSNETFRYEETVQTHEGGYSWILYPWNEWCVSLAYGF